MATQTFTWSPLLDPTGETKFLVRSAQFGDGYSQAVADGINNQVDTWPLTFTDIGENITPIKTFLDSLQGFQSFYWTPPLRAQGLFRCPGGYKVQAHGNDIYTLSATFQEVFNP